MLLDKPCNITSNAALQKCKRLFNARKAGHGGSLDPIAEGALPILFGNYTRLASHFLLSAKVYEGEFTLGATTTTGDSEGDVVTRGKVPPLTTDKIEGCLAKFRGTIQQKPPQFSAIKYQGKPSYKYARKGKEVPLPLREVRIYALELLDFSSAAIQLRVKCSKGTYIRSLAEDIGKELGCGAYVSKLRRTQVAELSEMVTIAQLTQAAEEGNITSYLTKSISLLTGLDEVYISPQQAQRFCYGSSVRYQGAEDKKEVCVLLQAEGVHSALLGLAEINQGKLHPRHIFVKPN